MGAVDQGQDPPPHACGLPGHPKRPGYGMLQEKAPPALRSQGHLCECEIKLLSRTPTLKKGLCKRKKSLGVLTHPHAFLEK